MSLATGARLGPYEITAKLGEGGMGEVYQAKDFQLGRNVALKVLPEGFTQDPERLARFEREAKLLAQLNHPNIAQIYGFEASGATRALVMELVDGPTLAERLEHGPLPFNESLSVSLQIAHALEEAHEKGIVHRDLKPQNIKASMEGKVKVLDFGLAKAMDRAGGVAGMSPQDLAHSPTLTLGGTREGMILGTAAYMAPEQARGSAVDKRADIWAFGVVLYEMLTGERLFSERSVVDTLSAVMRKEIDLGRLPPATPKRLRELVRRCLERDPKRRLRDIGEARILLADGFDSVDLPPGVPGSPSLGSPSWVVPVAILIALGSLSYALWRDLRSQSATDRGVGLPVSFQRVTDLSGVESSPSISPDGKSVVYVAGLAGERDLFLLRVGGRNPVVLTPESPGDDWQPAYSPDGARIAFRSEREGGGIFLMDATGESIRRLTTAGYDPSWSPDGGEIVFARSAVIYPTDRPAESVGLSAVEVATGRVREVLRRGDAIEPAWSPGGERIAFWGLTASVGGQRDIATVAADGSEAETGGVPLTSDAALDWSPAWSPDGRFVYFSSDRGGSMNVWRVAVDRRSGRGLEAPEPVTVPASWAGGICFSADGARMVYAALDWRSRLLRIGFDPEREELVGEPTGIVESTRAIRDHQLSPDGERIAYVQLGEGEALHVVRSDGRELRRPLEGSFRDRGPTWSPDGANIAFFSNRSGPYEIWKVRPDGSELERWTDLGGFASNPIWSPNGRQIAVTMFGGPNAGWRLVDAGSPGLPKPSIAGPPLAGRSGRFQPYSFSPDANRLAGFEILDDGRVGDLLEYRLDSAEYATIAVTALAHWRLPVWLADGRRLLVRDERGLAIVESGAGREKRLLDVGGYVFGMSVGVARDGRSITYTETATEGDIWVAELAKAAGTR